MNPKCLLLVLGIAAALIGEAAAQAPGRTQISAREQSQVQDPAQPARARVRPRGLITTVTLADIGLENGFRFAGLGGRRDVFLPLPAGREILSSRLMLALDDVSAHEARRSLEILIDDRSAAAVPLDGRSMGRLIPVPLVNAKASGGFLKLSFVYSGAATQDRCVDARYVGDSVTVRPESAVEIEVDVAGILDVATVAALMPRDVVVALPGRPLTTGEIAAALTVARSVAASRRAVSFQYGFDALAELAKRSDPRRWSRGLVLVGSYEEFAARLDFPIAVAVRPPAGFATLAAVRIGGLPALLVSDVAAQPAGRLLGSPSLAAARSTSIVAVGEVAMPALPMDRVSFDQLGLAPARAEVFGRADLSLSIDRRTLPAGTRPSRLLLDVMVAPDGGGERAVVSVFVDENLLGSMVAATAEPTRFDLQLPEGLLGTLANVRVTVQRQSPRGDCRFEPQGYPVQILGSSSLELASADARVRDFSDLPARAADGIEVLIPAQAAERPERTLGLLADVLTAISPETAPISVKLLAAGSVPAPVKTFIAVGDTPPADSSPRVRFDRGRVAVADRTGRKLLDLGGFTGGAVAQLVTAADRAGIWIRSLAADGALPASSKLLLDRGDVALLDEGGVALAMSTERDGVVRIAYPDQVSWLTIAQRFRPWVVGGLWLFATVVFLIVLQRMFRRRSGTAGE